MIADLRSLLRSRELFTTLVERHLLLRAKRSWTNRLWPLITPFVLLLPYVFLVRRVLDVPIPRYPQFLLCGLLPWGFVAQTLVRAAPTLSTEPELLRKARFPYELLPFSAVAAGAVHFTTTIVLFIAWLGLRGEVVWAALPALLVPMAALLLLVMALAMLVALADVYLRDLRMLLPSALTLWFFFVPVIYRAQMVPSSVRRLQAFEPMSVIVTQMRTILYDGRVGPPVTLLKMMLLAMTAWLVAFGLFRLCAPRLPQDV